MTQPFFKEFDEQTNKLFSADKAAPKNMFNNLINWLNEKQIRYALLGDTTALMDRDSNIDGDIDIVIDNYQVKEAIAQLSRLEENPFQLVQVIQHEPTAWYLTLSVVPKLLTASPVFIHPDICSHYYQHGKQYFSDNDLLMDRQQVKNDIDQAFYIPRAAAAFGYYFVKCVRKQLLSKARYHYLLTQYQQASDEALAFLERFFLPETLISIRQALDNDDWTTLKNTLPQYLSEMNKQAKFRPVDYIRQVKLKLSRVLAPSGFSIAFVGPDGAGKTTILESVEKQIQRPFRRILWRHLRPQLLQKVRRDNNKVETKPHGKLPRHWLLSMGKVFWFFIEAHLAYWAVVYPAMVKSTLVIFDRYLTDFYADPLRFRYKGPTWLVWALAKLTPQPNQLMIVVAEPDVLQARKPEVTFEESRRQMVEYRHWSYHTKHSLLVDTSASSQEESVRYVVNWLLQLLHQRTQRRYGHQGWF